MDRLTSLAVFGRVVECGGFSAAGRRLNMSVAMVSHHVQALEERLGARLLERTTRKVSLTEIGREYYQRSSQILADLDEADRTAGALQATPKGTLRLHASVNLSRFLAPIIGEYLDTYPGMSVDLTVGEQMVDAIEDGYDLVIRTSLPPDSQMIVRRLAAWRSVLCCAPSYLEGREPPHCLADLEDHNCLRFAFYPFGENWHFKGPDGKPVAVRSRGNLVTGSGEVLRHLAVSGQGIIFAPTLFVVDELKTGALIHLLPEVEALDMVVNAIYPSRHHLAVKVRSFLDLLAGKFAGRIEVAASTSSLSPPAGTVSDRQDPNRVGRSPPTSGPQATA